MNPNTENRRSDEIRQEIDATRQQMDQTIDALADRFKGRHIIDEVIGVFRSNASDETVSKIKDKVTSTTHTAVNSVVNTVKANPWPALLIGAGVAWLVYNSRRSSSHSDSYLEGPYEDDLDESDFELSGGGYGAGELSGDYEASDLSTTEEEGASGIGSKLSDVKNTVRDKANQAKDQLSQKASEVGDRVRQGAQTVKDRASQIGSQVQERGRQVYERSREQVVTTVNEHPIEVGLGVLALGIVAGLAIPTPNKVNEVVGPRVDKLRDQARERGRDLVNRGRNVVQAAAQAARQEAESQGITPDAIREKAGAVAQRTKQAATDTARQEGVLPESNPGSGTQPTSAGQAS